MNLANLPSTTSSNSRASGGGGGGNEEAGEKRTRFSLSQEEGSIGNTSDNLEAISEAASNHSVDSSLDEDEVDQEGDELDDANIIDNLSDMVSANVSGRGTPNVSGRDTPSSQVRCLRKLPWGLPCMMSAKKKFPLSLSQISGFYSFRLLFGDPLPHQLRTSYMEAP